MITLNELVCSLAGSSSGGYTYISEFHTAGTAARAATFVTIALYSVWVFLSPMAMLIIPEDWAFYIFTLEFKPWRLFLLSTSLINVWNAIALSFAPETPKFLLAMNRKEETLEVLSRIYAVNTGQSREVNHLTYCYLTLRNYDTDDIKSVISECMITCLSFIRTDKTSYLVSGRCVLIPKSICILF